jgi:hypothetical protein
MAIALIVYWTNISCFSNLFLASLQAQAMTLCHCVHKEKTRYEDPMFQRLKVRLLTESWALEHGINAEISSRLRQRFWAAEAEGSPSWRRAVGRWLRSWMRLWRRGFL